MKFQNWDLNVLPVEQLRLDADNPRLLTDINVRTQGDLVHKLVRQEDVAAVAMSIAEDGFFPSEILIAVPEDDEYVIVEGNRRLAAVMLLQDPNLAPQSRRATFKRMKAKGVGRVPDELPVAIAPDRVSTEALVLRRHTRESVRKWTMYAQACYVRSLMSSGDTVNDVATRLEDSADRISRLLLVADFYDVAKTLKLEEYSAKKVHDPQEFKLSTLARIIESKPGADFFALSRDTTGQTATRARAADFRAALAHVVDDIARNKQSTRTLNSSEGISNYLESLKKIKPSIAKRKSSLRKVAGTVTQSAKKSVASSSASNASSRRSSVSPSILPAGLVCSVANARIQSIFDELKRIPLRNNVNVIGVGLRMFVELSASEFLSTTNREAAFRTWLFQSKSVKINRSWLGATLEQTLEWLLNHDPNQILEGQDRRAVNRFLQQVSQPTSLRSLHDYVHNRHIQPTESDLRATALLLHPLLRVILS